MKTISLENQFFHIENNKKWKQTQTTAYVCKRVLFQTRIKRNCEAAILNGNSHGHLAKEYCL